MRNLQKKIRIKKRILRRAAEETLLSEKRDGDVSIAVVSNKAIKKMNLKFRDVDSATDVLAFSLEEKGFGEIPEKILGDVVISAEKALEQSEIFKEPFERELSRLSIHGTLHLLGYRDKKRTDKVKMKGKEESILKRLGALLGIIIFILTISSASSAELRFAQESKLLLGTVVDVQIWGDSGKTSAALKNAFTECWRIEDLLSVYKDKSEISQINKNAGEREMRVSDDAFQLIELAVRYGDYSDGAFDITIGPLIKLWGFFKKDGRLPGREELEKVLPLVSYRKIRLNKEEGTVMLSESGMEIDLGGIAKGYAVDCMVRILKSEGMQSGLVNAGGDIYAFGAPPGRKSWKAGIRHPRDKDNLLAAIQLKDEAVATSGDYENFFLIGEKRFSHIINPGSGNPAEHSQSVTVVAGSAVEADFLSTALFALGDVRGRELLEKFPNARAMFVKAKTHLPPVWIGHPAH